jgi:tetratricopeptide (TPR) repeat protein
MKKKKSDTEPVNKICVLVIEETMDLRAFFSGILKSSENFTAKGAGTVNDAFKVLSDEHETIHFILFNWKMSNTSGNLFAQRLRKNPSYDHIELITFSQVITEDDTFLMVEIDIHHTIPKIINGAQFLEKMEKIRKSYLSTSPIQKKIKELQHWIHEENIQKCDEILSDPKVEFEIQNNPKFIYLQGEVLILRNQYGEAINFFETIMKDKKKKREMETLRSMSTFGKVLCLVGRYDEALIIFERLEAKSSKNLNHKLMAGEALLGLERTDNAQEKFMEVIENSPDEKNALLGMAKSHSIAGNHEVAKSFFDKIEGEFESRSLASFYNNKGVSLVKQNKFDEAISFYKNAMQFFKKFKGHIYFNLGMAYYRAGRISESADCFQTALTTNEFDLIAEKTLLKEFQEKGIDRFIAEYNQKNLVNP